MRWKRLLSLGLTIPAITAFAEDARRTKFRSLQEPCVQSCSLRYRTILDNAEVRLHLRLSGGLLARVPSWNYQVCTTSPPRGLTLWTVSNVADNRAFYNCFVASLRSAATWYANVWSKISGSFRSRGNSVYASYFEEDSRVLRPVDNLRRRNVTSLRFQMKWHKQIFRETEFRSKINSGKK